MLNHLARNIFSGPPMAPQVALGGKRIIVTGASPGSIGYETAKTLAAWGATVILTTRTHPDSAAKSIAAELQREGMPATLDAYPLDLTDARSVAEFVRWYLNKYGERLDVLVNNAGIHLDLLSQWKAPQLTADGFEIHWRTNYLGTMQLTHLLLPLLKQTGKTTGDARVVNVASHLHHKGRNSDLFKRTRPYNSWEAYGNSKLALVHGAFEIQRRFSGEFNLSGYVLHPGSISTNIAHKGLEGNRLLQGLRKLFVSLEAIILMTPHQGAQTQILCATSPQAKGGVYYDRCEPGNPGKEAEDSGVAEKLWQETERWVAGLNNPTRAATNNLHAET